MRDNLLIYDVETNDTIISIAEKIGMTGDELRDFHNANCREVGLLWFNGLTGIEKVVIPKDYKSQAQIRKDNTDAVPPRSLPIDFYAKTYQVSEKFESDIEKNIEINYSVDLQLQERNENHVIDYIASVRCYDFKKDGFTPDDKMSGLSIACMDAISSMSFIISQKGKISGVHELKNLHQTFKQKRKDLEDFFIGEVSTKYMDKFEESLSNKDYFENQIKTTLLYQVLFPKMDWFHKESAWKEEFNLVKNSFPLNCIFKVDFNHLDDGLIQTDIKGEIDDRISLQELLQGRKFEEEPEEPLVGVVEIKYTTQKNTKQLLEAEAGIALLHEGEVYRKQKIKLSKI